MRLILLLTVLAITACSTEEPWVSVEVGPTNIPRGDALGAGDITVNNGLFAVAFAVDTAPPWGVARGGIIDIAIVRDGMLDYDIASLADFLPNSWSAWPTSYQHVEIESHSHDEVVIRTQRDWGAVELETRFTIRADDTRIHIVTTMTNENEVIEDELLSGYIVWPDGGALIEEPVVASTAAGATGWTASYDESWALGLHAPFADVTNYSGRDRYLSHVLETGTPKSFEAWLQIESEGSLAPMIQTEIEFGELASGSLRGTVMTSDGERVPSPAVVVSNGESILGWTVGRDGQFEMQLPVGTYAVRATAAGHGDSATREIRVADGVTTEVSFNDVQPPGSIRMMVSADGVPADARVSIEEGRKPLIAYHGRDVFFTELKPVGELTAQLAPGDYELSVSSGGGFTSLPQAVDVKVAAGEVTDLAVAVPVLANPADEGWYSADMHHHSDVLDGFTEAEYVLRSQLAAGVQVAFLSDHDSVINNADMQAMSAQRDVPFIAGTELSPSWGHFNAYPLDDGKHVEIDTGKATVQEVFVEARRMGADVIAVNHPYSEYGYFENHEHGDAPGGFDHGFDFIEISPVLQSTGEPFRNRESVERAWQMWNEGERKYLVGGSDVHDVWRFRSARARSYAHVAGELTFEKFVAALQAGHSYASQGPLVYPEILFGSDVSHEAGTSLSLKYTVFAANGLKSATLISRGRVVMTRLLEGSREDVDFVVTPGADTWYGLIVEDAAGRVAYTNPVWVNSEAGTGGE